MLRGSVIARNLLVKGMSYSTATGKVAVRGAVEGTGQRLLKHCNQWTNKTTKTKNMSEMHVPALVERDPLEPIVPACGIPNKVITGMVVAGAKKEEVEGEDLCVLRVEGVDSEAWKLYEDWASALGDVDPVVAVRFAPPLHLRDTRVCPPNALAGDIQDEATSIINHFAPLLMKDFVDGIPALLASFAPLPAPATPINVHHAKVAVTALQRGIRNPGPNFAVINGLRKGVYKCQVEYTWSGVVVVVPIFRMR